jgi:CRISPR-associated endonuclease/helicase Cas3
VSEASKKYVAHVRINGEQQSLDEHLLGVGKIAAGCAAKLDLSLAGELLGLLHDLGKYSDEFQNYLKSAIGLLNQDEDEEFVDAAGLKGKIDHSTAGAQIVWRELSTRGPMGVMTGQMLALCIASHHSGLIDCLGADLNHFGEDNFSRRMGKAEVHSHVECAWNRLEASLRERVETLLAHEDLFAGIQKALVCIRKNNGKGIVEDQQTGLLARFLFSCLIDADRLDSAIFEKPRANRHRPQGEYADWQTLVDRLEHHLDGLVPRHPIDEARRDIAQHCLEAAQRGRGIYTLSVPTGGGKTLASLRFALHHAKQHKLDRIIYVIPYTSIIDQNAKVVRGILEPEGSKASRGSIVLEHHSNLLPEVQGWREKMLIENWDAPVIYTTMVQFLETLFGAGTRGARRMHQLANAVIVFDEVQSLPVKCVHFFNNALQFLVDCCGSTAVLCTATQPLLHRVEAKNGALRLKEDSELMPDVGGLFDDLKRVDVLDQRKPDGWSEDEIADLAVGELQNAGSCLVIVNTKNAARELYRKCKAKTDACIVHLSTSMCPGHRKRILAIITHRLKSRFGGRKPVLCVSTQLIEAGVDVDFGSVIRYMAGLDSIAQAAGRCNRHRLREVGHVHVVNPAQENLSRLPDIAIGIQKTKRVLDEYRADPAQFSRNLIGPQAISRYYDYYFFDRRNDMSYPVSSQSIGHDDSLLNLLSGNTLASQEYGNRNGQMPSLHLRQSFMTAAKAFKAIDTPTQGVIVPFGKEGEELINDLCGAFDVEKQYKLLRRAQQYTVNVFPHELEKLQAARAVYPVQEDIGILHLHPDYYSPDFGLMTEPGNFMKAKIA